MLRAAELHAAFKNSLSSSLSQTYERKNQHDLYDPGVTCPVTLLNKAVTNQIPKKPISTQTKEVHSASHRIGERLGMQVN
jgi:hypothetical protein